jgi:hypothetical protein
MQPRYPIYVPTKRRSESLITVRALDKLRVERYFVVVEPQEVAKYLAAGVDPSRVLILPDNDRGLVFARNWIWDHATTSNVERYWTMDDNIGKFYRLNRGLKVPLATPSFLRFIEDFVDRYENVPLAGMHYYFFCKGRDPLPPFYVNSRVYSNMLILTRATNKRGEPYRFEGNYNDDTDLSLRILKDGYCTILLAAFLAGKAATMTVDGGMGYKAADVDDPNGDRLRASRELCKKHPDVSRLVYKFGRWHHHVDYSPFQPHHTSSARHYAPLRFKRGVEIERGVDNYGMIVKYFPNGAPE